MAIPGFKLAPYVQRARWIVNFPELGGILGVVKSQDRCSKLPDQMHFPLKIDRRFPGSYRIDDVLTQAIDSVQFAATSSQDAFGGTERLQKPAHIYRAQAGDHV